MVFPAKRLIPHIKMTSSGIILLTFISVFDKIKQTRYQCRNCGGTDTDMKKIISLLLAIITAASLLSLTSCNEKNSAELYGYFDTDGMLYDYNGLSKRKFNSLLKMVNDELREYHELYDIYHEYAGKSNAMTLNENAGKGPVKVDGKLIDLLVFAKELYTLTSGEVNVAMGAVLSIWHDCREDSKKKPPVYRAPSEEELEAAAEHTDINDVIIDEAAGTVELRDPEMSLDLGAVGKGYAVEMVAKMIEEKYGGGFVLDVGGNLRTIGSKPDGTGWLAGVRNPDQYSMETTVYKIYLQNLAMVTSGSYERVYTVDGVSYHHIINPETLFPTEYYLSLTVISESSARSDALSTALFNMRYEELSDFVSGNEDIFVIIVLPSGEVETLGKAPEGAKA